uniref:NACHT-NTPase sigma domain-containing protein n=1 Tax=Fusarium oxysporum (strain Fo5176) TaxID=660025 RepID=A0A0D2Y9C8_FUSOF
MVAAAEPARNEFPDGVKIWHSPEDAELDICFIHGLSGNRDKTWTAPGQPNPWPAELLPSRLAKARLLTYGYDAFGGIICKTALIISRQSPESHLRQINNQYLEFIQTSFLSMIHDLLETGRPLQITCFFEELPMPGVGTIVSKESASLEGYSAFSIHANHSDMVKFGSASENGFKRLLGELVRWDAMLGMGDSTVSPVAELESDGKTPNVTPPLQTTTGHIFNNLGDFLRRPVLFMEYYVTSQEDTATTPWG